MKISLRDNEKTLAEYLPGLKSSRLTVGDPDKLPTRTIRCRVPMSGPLTDLARCDLGFLFRYDVFPPEILKFFGEWELHGRTMRPGDVIVQQAEIPPGGPGLKLLFGVRVLSVSLGPTSAGFSYGTLAGHPETGTNRFTFSFEDGVLFAAVHTAAASGLFVSRLLDRVFTRRYVAFCNGAALRRMVANFSSWNAHPGERLEERV